MEIKELIEIGSYLNMNDVVTELKQLEQRLQDPVTPLILPLVGEFSAGKTSLLNALTDSKQLEVASLPTTSTIYELHFGQERQFATMIQADGEEKEFESISSLKNSQLVDVPLVKVYDTSTRVPRDLILVDTPGLSSPDQKHKDALIRFLPQADALLITVDCNQQITNSLLRFMEECQLTERNIYLILTKCDTKPISDLKEIKQYIAQNCKLAPECIVCVSANTGDMTEFYDLIERLSKSKKDVLQVSIQARIEKLKTILIDSIEQLLKLPNTTDELEEQLFQSKKEERKIMLEIDDLMKSVKHRAEDVSSELCGRYRSLIYSRLERLVAQKSDNMTAEANRILYMTSSLIMKEYRGKVTEALVQQALKGSFFIQTAVKRLDLENLETPIAEITIDLNNVGHERDGKIANIVQWGVLAVAAVGGGVLAATRGAVQGGAAAANVQASISAADTATDLGSMLYMRRLIGKQQINRVNKIVDVGNKAVDMGKKVVDNYSKMAGSIPEKAKGILTNLVGRVTELTAKPQRLRVIDSCVREQIMPEFETGMQQNTHIILTALQEVIQSESQQMLTEQTEQIIALQDAIKAQNGEYQQRISTLKTYQTQLKS